MYGKVCPTVCIFKSSATSILEPPIEASVPTYNFLAILAPPSVLKAPVSPVASDESVVLVMSTTPLKVLVPV